MTLAKADSFVNWLTLLGASQQLMALQLTSSSCRSCSVAPCTAQLLQPAPKKRNLGASGKSMAPQHSRHPADPAALLLLLTALQARQLIMQYHAPAALPPPPGK
jgi:hypothetical protein